MLVDTIRESLGKIETKRSDSFYRPIKPNSNKIVKISRIGTGSSQAVTWNTFLSTLLANKTQNKKIVGNKLFNNLDVNDNVKLTFTDFPKLAGEVSLQEPIKELLKSTGFGENIATVAAVVSAFKNKGNSDPANIFNPYLVNAPAYDPASPKPLTWETSFEFTMGKFGLWNAEEEVVKPILNLMSPAFVREFSAFTQVGPMPTPIEMIINILTKDNLSALGSSVTGKSSIGEVLSSFTQTLESVVLTAYNNYSYVVQYGNFATFSNVLITAANVNWNTNEVDQNGYPISGSITLKFRTLTPAALSYKGTALSSPGVRFGE